MARRRLNDDGELSLTLLLLIMASILITGTATLIGWGIGQNKDTNAINDCDEQSSSSCPSEDYSENQNRDALIGAIVGSSISFVSWILVLYFGRNTYSTVVNNEETQRLVTAEAGTASNPPPASQPNLSGNQHTITYA